ncbi:hypothetical protein CONPUDRAFT_164428 [Coniophora puteana RWD-64-598 SS2]|uniref:Zn(2)-C6 fungal-type domain-containing protein n=1 Tax=Coniophora puteana (strain RWD-64-598) TaxID=741705 RepID=A0A5M3MWY4_CONPW|nr:uncharacterized protein CONPUDRAFT_164428 [Coniophora puteana RWD-64-598 SS2]EIW83497.1 hypothetical protein CONPUDRAFT_164428 [Coniophora puteana RWD-64-598 SS2]
MDTAYDDHFPFATHPDPSPTPGNGSYVDSAFYHPQTGGYYDPAAVQATGCPQSQVLYDQTPYLYSDLESATLVPCPETSDGPWADYSLVPHPEPPRPYPPTEHYAPSGRSYTYPITVSYTLAHGLGQPPAKAQATEYGLIVKHEYQEHSIKAEEMCTSPVGMDTDSSEMWRWHHPGQQMDHYASTPRFTYSTSAPASASAPAPAYGTFSQSVDSGASEPKMALMDSLRPPPGVAISHTQFQSYSPAREAARSLPPLEQQGSFFGEHRSPTTSGNITSPAPTPSDVGMTPTWVAPDQPLVVPSQAHLAPRPTILTTALAPSPSPISESPDTPSLIGSPISPMSPTTSAGASSSSSLPHSHSHSHSHSRVHRRRASTPNTHAHVKHRSRSRSNSPKVRLSPNPSARKLAEKKPALACLFCRGRKIACGPPLPGSNDKTCNQCARRHLKCEYPVESRRGMRKRKTTFSPPALSSTTATTAASSTASDPQRTQPQPQVLAPTQSVLDLGTRPGHGADMDMDLGSP